MITAADGAAQFYDHENVARYENEEEAVIRDKALRAAYLGHNQIFVIGNEHSFEDKIQSAINAVSQVLGLPEQRSIYRKYLVDTRMHEFQTDDK